MSRLYMRTSAEAHMYMDQQPCTCGDIEFDRQSAVMLDGGELCSRYSGKCRSCGTMREFIFQLPPKQRPITDQLEYGGSDPSRLLDAGQWLGISEYYAKLTPGTPDDLAIARAALEEVLKFMPEGVDTMPETAFWTERGRMVREREPGRFRRARLAAILDAYRAVTVPPAVRSAFVAGLERNSSHAVVLPDPLPMGRVLHVRNAANRGVDVLKVLAGENEKGYFLDYFRETNDGETTWHGRVLHDGTVEALENYEGQFGFPAYPDDPERTAAEKKRILEHNIRVKHLLKAKGFE